MLTPLDEFALSTAELPTLALTGRGTSYEMEFNRTLSNGSFFRLGLFDQNLRDAQDALLGSVERAQLSGARLGYSGLLNRQTAFFVNGNFNRAKNEMEKRDIDNVPRFSAETGLQFLNRKGWFVQPSFVYGGSRSTLDANATATTLGGFSLWNLQVGKRWGLRSILTLGVSNVFGKDYALLSPELTQPARKFRVGATQRF